MTSFELHVQCTPGVLRILQQTLKKAEGPHRWANWAGNQQDAAAICMFTTLTPTRAES